MSTVIRLRKDQFTEMVVSKGWTRWDGTFGVKIAASSIGCAASSVSRILRDEATCSAQFIGAVLRIAKPWKFEDLFWIDASSNDREDAA